MKKDGFFTPDGQAPINLILTAASSRTIF